MKFNWKLGVSYCSWPQEFGERYSEKMFRMYSENNIECLELGLDSLRQSDYLDYKKIYEYSKEYNVILNSFHLPFFPIEKCGTAWLEKEIREKAIIYICDFINKISDIGIKIAVMHPSLEIDYFGHNVDHAPYMKAAKDSISKICDFASKKGVILAIENLPRSCLGNSISEMKELISVDDRIRICFDSNHSLKDDNIDFIKTFGDKIVTTHISDYDKLDEKHWLPFEGKNDWLAICNALKNAQYKGVFMYELSLKAPKTISREMLSYADIRENYLAIMNGEKLAPKGKIIEN